VFLSHLGRNIALLLLIPVIAGSDSAISQSADLDISKWSLTFSEDFDDGLSVSPWGPNTRWIAHTPWHGDFGDARFADPLLGFPFSTKNGVLQIEARIGRDGKWESGLLASTDENGRGFSQQYGYFEMRAKLPRGPGVWPAFWLGSIADKKAPASVEIDVMEFYGHAPFAYRANIHVWPANSAEEIAALKSTEEVRVKPNSLSDEYNTYGVMVNAEWIVFYFNRREVFRVKTPIEHQRPLGVLLNLALGSGWPIDQTPNPSTMYVDYVHVYKQAKE
jgi:beta-glucanase (GH16 family)